MGWLESKFFFCWSLVQTLVPLAYSLVCPHSISTIYVIYFCSPNVYLTRRRHRSFCCLVTKPTHSHTHTHILSLYSMSVGNDILSREKDNWMQKLNGILPDWKTNSHPSRLKGQYCTKQLITHDYGHIFFLLYLFFFFNFFYLNMVYL